MQAEAAVIDGALDVIAQSQSCVEENRRLLSETRYRIAASRRRLNPAFAVTGASDGGDEWLRAWVRARLASGALFPVGPKATAGNGSGRHRCVVCGNPVGRLEVEYEIAVGETSALVSHIRCYVVWRAESVAQERKTA